ERQTIADPATAVVADDDKALMAKGPHQGMQPLRHPTLGTGAFRRAENAAQAIAGQIGKHHGMVAGKHRGNAVPGRAGLRIAMQQQHRGPRSPGPDRQFYSIQFDSAFFKPGEQEIYWSVHGWIISFDWLYVVAVAASRKAAISLSTAAYRGRSRYVWT